MGQKLDRRLALIEGQVKGIRKMLDEQRDCMEIVQQIAAVRAGLAKVGVEVLKDESVTCIKNKDKYSQLDTILESIFKLT